MSLAEELRKMAGYSTVPDTKAVFESCAAVAEQYAPENEQQIRARIAKELYEYPEYRGVMKIAAGLVDGSYEPPDWRENTKATFVPPAVDQDFSDRMEQVFSRISYTQNRLMALNLPASEAGLLVAADLQEQAALTIVEVLEAIGEKFSEAAPVKKLRAVLKKSAAVHQKTSVVNRDLEPGDSAKAIQARVDEEARKTVEWIRNNPEKLEQLSSGPMGTAMVPDIQAIELESEKEEQIRKWIEEHPGEVFAPGNPNVPGFIESMMKRQVANAAAVQWMEDQKARGVRLPWELPEDEEKFVNVENEDGTVSPVLPNGLSSVYVGDRPDEEDEDYWDGIASQARGEAIGE